MPRLNQSFAVTRREIRAPIQPSGTGQKRDPGTGQLGRIASLCREYQLLGAVAGMVVPDQVGRYAYRKGLFVLAQSGHALEIRNDTSFQPKTW